VLAALHAARRPRISLSLDWSLAFTGAMMPFAAALVSVGVSRDTDVDKGILSTILFVSCEGFDDNAAADELAGDVDIFVTG